MTTYHLDPTQKDADRKEWEYLTDVLHREIGRDPWRTPGACRYLGTGFYPDENTWLHEIRYPDEHSRAFGRIKATEEYAQHRNQLETRTREDLRAQLEADQATPYCLLCLARFTEYAGFQSGTGWCKPCAIRLWNDVQKYELGALLPREDAARQMYLLELLRQSPEAHRYIEQVVAVSGSDDQRAKLKEHYKRAGILGGCGSTLAVVLPLILGALVLGLAITSR